MVVAPGGSSPARRAARGFAGSPEDAGLRRLLRLRLRGQVGAGSLDGPPGGLSSNYDLETREGWRLEREP